MNGQYYRWTMENGREKRFMTAAIDANCWQFTDSATATTPAAQPVLWRTGDILEMREREQDEIIGHPSRVQILGFTFDAATIGTRDAIKMRAKIITPSPHASAGYQADREVVFDSELARAAYQLSSRPAALVA